MLRRNPCLRLRWELLVTLAVTAMLHACASNRSTLPPPLQVPTSPREPVVDDYFGTKVVDPYRWMEDRDAPRFVDWLQRQDAYARAVLGAIPGRDRLLERLQAHSAGGSVVRGVRQAGGRVFYLKRNPGDDALKLYVLLTPEGPERRLVDPALAGGAMSIDYFRPSPDGRRVAYGLSEGGSEQSVLHILEVDGGEHAPETIDRTPYAEPSWRPDGTGFYYNRLAEHTEGMAEAEKYLHSRAWLHQVGTPPERDVPVLGTGVAGSPALQPVDSPYVQATAGSEHVLAMISHGADAAMSVFVARANPGAGYHWKKVADAADGVTAAALHGDELYLLTRKDAPRFKVLQVDANAPDLARARTVVPCSERVIQDIAVAADGLYLSELDGGLGRLRRYGFSTRTLTEISLPLEGAVRGPVTEPARAGALVGLQNWITPESWRYVDDSGQSVSTRIVAPWNVDTSPYLVEEVRARSWDGTLIPLSIVRRRDARLDASSPVWLTAYGAYGVSMTPSFSGVYGTSRLMPLVEDGGMYAVCHVRGGGEYGDAWRLAGAQENKPNSYKDLLACADHLIARGYTRPSALALEGASAGGIVVGMALTARPDLFKVVFSRVGDNNPLRLEQGADGPIVAAEFGSTRTQAGFRALYAIDPTQHVRAGTAYPAVMLTTGFNDARVPPWQPGKLAAHLQAATASGHPVILRVEFEGGHVASSGARSLAEHADMLAFFYAQLGRTDAQTGARD
ncbi:S9 family peptidase [Pyxidicoccus parkwayensis]|uniref:prolyl oligopeptidase n=1 Tax=Pyxidicoccus parkwayensis TaxID=2813578 RepID=A0ABX7NZZ8_9BACT|nr:prolyl oligopeptidase family serine peptidase [Pyxidicoccus parkwaysis]QSQ24512.1 S9 family peptidase [Pyxidicoccus parkwaysis]